MERNKKPFFPKDKPKSWVVGVSSGLLALLVAGPIVMLGIYLEAALLKNFGITIFVLCWAAFMLSWVIFAVNGLSGKYRDIKEKEWNEQIW